MRSTIECTYRSVNRHHHVNRMLNLFVIYMQTISNVHRDHRLHFFLKNDNVDCRFIVILWLHIILIIALLSTQRFLHPMQQIFNERYTKFCVGFVVRLSSNIDWTTLFTSWGYQFLLPFGGVLCAAALCRSCRQRCSSGQEPGFLHPYILGLLQGRQYHSWTNGRWPSLFYNRGASLGNPSKACWIHVP